MSVGYETRAMVRRHELLTDVVVTATKRLVDNGLSYAEAELMASDLADHFAQHWGGQVISFPKDYRRVLSQLELEIYAKFTGNNYDELARQYGLTMSGMRKLIGRTRARLAKAGQPDLFEHNQAT